MQKRTIIPGCAGLRVLAVFLSVAIGPSNMFKIVLDPESPKVNQAVRFNVTGISERIRFSEWYRGNDTSAANQILRFNNNDNSINKGQKYIQNAEIFADGSLQITNVTKGLEGNYTVFIQGNENPFQQTVYLNVDQSGGLSGGAIAGIVIGVIAFIAAIVGGVYAFKSKDSGPI